MLGQYEVNPTLAVKDLAQAKTFYEQKLGFEFIPDESNDAVGFFKVGKTKVEVYVSEFAGTNKSTALTIGIGDEFQHEVSELKQKGISFEHYENMPGTKLEGDIHVMPGMNVAWFKDPSGNIICIHNQQ